MITFIFTEKEAGDIQFLIDSGFFTFKNGEWTGRRTSEGILISYRLSLEGRKKTNKMQKPFSTLDRVS